MERERRAQLARAALGGYESGHEAPIRATKLALAKADTADAIIIVEGISDQIAIETLASRRGRNLELDGVAVLPIGGAQAARRYLLELGPAGQGRTLVGCCDADGAESFRRGLVAAQMGSPRSVTQLAVLGFQVCVDDLEDELIRAVGTDGVEAVLESQGDLRPFRTMQRQPEWRDRETADQLHRFLRSGSRRSLRYARLLIDAADLDRIPGPLDAVLEAVS